MTNGIIKCAMKHNLLDTSMNDCQERMANNHVLKVLFKFLNNTLWWLPKQWQNSIDYIYYAFEQLSNWFVVNLNNAGWGINQKIIKIILPFARTNLYTKKKKKIHEFKIWNEVNDYILKWWQNQTKQGYVYRIHDNWCILKA